MPELAPVTLGCDEEIVVPEIKAEDEPPSSYEVILGVVALPTSDSSLEPLAVDPVPTSDSLDESLPSPQPSEGFWVKSGLLVRAGASVQMLVPQQLRDRMWIHWGYAGGDWTWDVTVPGCEGERAEWVLRDGETEWRVFAGGFWVNRARMCSPAGTKRNRRTADQHRSRRPLSRTRPTTRVVSDPENVRLGRTVPAITQQPRIHPDHQFEGGIAHI